MADINSIDSRPIAPETAGQPPTTQSVADALAQQRAAKTGAPKSPAAGSAAASKAGPANGASSFDKTAANPYTGGSAAPGSPEASSPYQISRRLMTQAGAPLPSPAELQAAAAKAPNSPAYAALVADLKKAESVNGGGGPQLATQALQDAKTAVGDDGTGLNVWAIVQKALMDTAKDAQADQQQHIKKLQTMSAIQKQMQAYGDTLQQTQSNLDAKIGSGKKADTNAQVSMPNQLSFEEFGSLDSKGHAVSTNLVTTNKATQVTPKDLTISGDKQGQYDLGHGGQYKFKFGLPSTVVDNLSGNMKKGLGFSHNTITAYGKNEAEARNAAVSKYNQAQHSNSSDNQKGMVGTQGLAALNTRYGQQLDLLNNQIQQEQSLLQNSIQSENQQYTAITSLISTMKDMNQTVTRNIAS
jgi:hypothetical protein